MAGSQRNRPSAAIWHAEDVRTENISTTLMRPLYTSCREHREELAKNRDPFYHPANNGGLGTFKSSSFSNNDSAEPRQLRPRFLTLNSLPRMPSTSPESQRREPMVSPFLRLPAEIRLQIYSLLVFPRRSIDLLISSERSAVSAVDAVDYQQWKVDEDGNVSPDVLKNPTLRIRTVDPTRYKARYADHPHVRTAYSVRADRFAARCMNTTYHCVNVPRIEHNLAILRANKQIHAEAAEMMYSNYTFDFDTHIEAIIPFLRDLTPFTRSCIKSIRLTKRALAYLKEFDRCEWDNALRYLTNGDNKINLRRLELGVVAGRPGERGWDRIATYSAADFNLLKTHEDMAWLQYLEEINKLQELEVHAVIEHCPPVTSSTNMANFVRFSASVEGGFAEYLKGQLLAPEVQKRLMAKDHCWA
ncbi:Putative 2EXR domain-containing protein [Septoria linicola]|uniref:2EXR domain-containing protein n=1 Tax=Septoria linicola TaxID=215465 RepID=A0A9Q9B1G5_9PEZI|nr:putative 2EXR domain-containing protein [Septoria linicola]USW55692.1 Putative 2EXR domain-containing protein [Septoria linicola]